MKLPLDCNTEYIEGFVSEEESAAIFEWLYGYLDLQDRETMHMADGYLHQKSQWSWLFVDQELISHSMLAAAHGRRMGWPPLVSAIRDRVEQVTGVEFSVCLCLYYSNGEEGLVFHSDPPAFGSTSLLPSISLGERREFLFRRRSDPTELYSIELSNGSLLIMGEGCQDEYEHSLPVNPKYRNPRINLTFRQFEWPAGLKPSRDSRLKRE